MKALCLLIHMLCWIIYISCTIILFIDIGFDLPEYIWNIMSKAFSISMVAGIITFIPALRCLAGQ